MGTLIGLDLRLQLGHGLATGHQVGDLLAGALALAEVGGKGTADEDGEVVAHGHGVGDVVGDQDDRDALLPRLHDDAQHVGGFLDAERCGRLVEDQHVGAEVDGPADRQRLALTAGKPANQTVSVGDPGDA